MMLKGDIILGIIQPLELEDNGGFGGSNSPFDPQKAMTSAKLNLRPTDNNDKGQTYL
jgi:hypothetical protein